MKTLMPIINSPAECDSFLSYCIHMAEDMNLNLHLLYIQDPQAYPLGSTGATGAAAIQFERNLEIERETAMETLKTKAAENREKLKSDVSFRYSTEIGSRNMIADLYVSGGDADMLVLESQKEMNFWSLHATNMDMIMQVNCPVWIIPDVNNYKPFRKIVYATDFNEEDINTMKSLIKLAYKYNPSISALHVLKSSKFEEKVKSTGFQDMIREQTEYKDISLKTVQQDSESDTGQTVNSFAVNEKADLVVVLKENHGFFKRILKPSRTNEILSETDLPVLVFHEKE